VRFLLSRRWLIFFVVIVLAAWGASLLGQWQFSRLHEKRAANHRIVANLAASPVQLDTLLTVSKPADPDDEWRRVTVHGTWDDAHTVVVKYQTNVRGAPGIDVATPLVTAAGPAVMVDRGWMQTKNNGDDRPTTPAVTAGQVTVTGWVRVNASGSATRVSAMSTRALSTVEVAKLVPYPLYGNFLDLSIESPAPAHALGAIEMPDDSGDGPHFFYGLQWYFFGALAIFGFFFLMYDEWQRMKADRTLRASKAAQQPSLDG
jgi:cytochrome oxidase assembly protein ShyY1